MENKLDTPRGNRINIAIIGRTNAGKSSLINAICNEEISITSEVAGTTTDAVKKPYELIPVGPVTFFDTAGIDDISNLGELRIKATKKILYKSDIALIVIDENGILDKDKIIINEIKQLNIPFIVIFNKVDVNPAKQENVNYCTQNQIKHIQISSKNKLNINELKQLIIKIIPPELKEDPLLIGDIINKGDNVILVVPIDLSAPKGRIILPQVMTIREILDVGANAIVIKEDQIIQTLDNLKNPPRLVITDSQAIEKVSQDVPMNIPLTTFSTVFARFKGDFNVLLKGAAAIENLKDNDKILIAEACSHHVQKDDIGRFKIPNWIKKYTGKKLTFDTVAGGDFPENLEDYALVISCGACMLNRCEMMRRITECVRRGIPISNYGIVISKAHGTLERTTQPFL